MAKGVVYTVHEDPDGCELICATDRRSDAVEAVREAENPREAVVTVWRQGEADRTMTGGELLDDEPTGGD